MEKNAISVMITLLLILSSSCVKGNIRTALLDKFDDGKSANARFEKVIEAIRIKDKDAIRAVFSEKAHNDADAFEATLDHLFSFMEGRVDSWEKADGPTMFESIDNGHKKKEVGSYYYVMATVQPSLDIGYFHPHRGRRSPLCEAWRHSEFHRQRHAHL
jgi:hypothetical protein